MASSASASSFLMPTFSKESSSTLFQMNDGLSEITKLTNIDNVPVDSLFRIAYKILDESMEKMDVEKFQVWLSNLSSLLKKFVQAIEGRSSNLLANLSSKDALYKNRHLKYQSRIRILEILVKGTSEEYDLIRSQLLAMKIEKAQTEADKKLKELEVNRLVKEKNNATSEISLLKKKLEMTKKGYEEHSLLLEAKYMATKGELETKLKDIELLLLESRRETKEREILLEKMYQRRKNREPSYQKIITNQFGGVQDLKADFGFMKQQILELQTCVSEEFSLLGSHFKRLADVAANYPMLLAENRRLYNEVQDLKGNIRVYCRIRPFLQGQSRKLTTIEYVGENGELIVVNPLKQAKDSHRLFKFNKAFGPTATQEEVFLDTQPLIRSVLDGYNVCIFAYGQTGSGKTYTMTGPNISSTKDWGVNYRALNDLFNISQSRKASIIYEIQVQMVEIYNEQVRDLLSDDGLQKRLEIWTSSKPNGLAVPDANMHHVKSMTDVLNLMNIGFLNRAVGATALNERSSRSHSVLSIHVHGMDLKSDTVLHGNLHMIDLAGSERVERSEATGNRLREAQHINKSLSALGDVIFALAQKSAHVPYRNSKLTQVLQDSLGGQAKSLMFVQLNPDLESYSETISTLKFAERVSGVELGAARSNKQGRDVKGLVEQLASLRETIGKKDEEIEQLKMLKHKLAAASYLNNWSEQSDKQPEAASHLSIDEFKQNELIQESKPVSGYSDEDLVDNLEQIGFGGADYEERLSDKSDGKLSVGAETDASICGAVDLTLFPKTAKPAENLDKYSAPFKVSKPEQAQRSAPPLSRVSSKSNKPMLDGSSSKQSKRWQ